MSRHSPETLESAHEMSCMEIWGGNRATQQNVTLPGLDAWVYSCPYQQAESGGDVYYVSNCATGRITRLMLADVSGHGTAVSETANHLRLLMRRFVNHVQQVKFVSSMNDEFATLNHAGGFATAVVATFLAPTRSMAFSNAGHPIPLFYSAQDRRWRLLEQPRGPKRSITDLPLGIFENGNYDQLEVKLDVGDLILFYTDAFIESRGADGEMLGSEQFLELVAKLDGQQPEKLIDLIISNMTSLHPGNLTQDDVTLLLFRPSGLEARVPLVKKLLAPFRLLKGIAISLLNGGRGMPLPDYTLANLIKSRFHS